MYEIYVFLRLMKRVETTSIEDGSTVDLISKKVISEWIENRENNNKQNFISIQKHEQLQEIDGKFLSTIPIFYTNCHLKKKLMWTITL